MMRAREAARAATCKDGASNAKKEPERRWWLDATTGTETGVDRATARHHVLRPRTRPGGIDSRASIFGERPRLVPVRMSAAPATTLERLALAGMVGVLFASVMFLPRAISFDEVDVLKAIGKNWIPAMEAFFGLLAFAIQAMVLLRLVVLKPGIWIAKRPRHYGSRFGIPLWLKRVKDQKEHDGDDAWMVSLAEKVEAKQARNAKNARRERRIDRKERASGRKTEAMLACGTAFLILFLGQFALATEGVLSPTGTMGGLQVSSAGPGYQLTDPARLSFTVATGKGGRAWIEAERDGIIIYRQAAYVHDGQNTLELILSPEHGFREGDYTLRVYTTYTFLFIFLVKTQVFSKRISIRKETAIVTLDCSIDKVLDADGLEFMVTYSGVVKEDDGVPVENQTVSFYWYDAALGDYQCFGSNTTDHLGRYEMAGDRRKLISPWPFMAKAITAETDVYEGSFGTDSVTEQQAYANWAPAVPDSLGWIDDGSPRNASYYINPTCTGLESRFDWGNDTGEANDYLGFTATAEAGRPGIGIGTHTIYLTEYSRGPDVDAGFTSRVLRYSGINATSATISVRFGSKHVVRGNKANAVDNTDQKTSNVTIFTFFLEVLDYLGRVVISEQLASADDVPLCTRTVNVTGWFQAPRTFRVRIGARIPASRLAPPTLFNAVDEWFAMFDWLLISIRNDPQFVSSTLVEGTAGDWRLQELTTRVDDDSLLSGTDTITLTNMQELDSRFTDAWFGAIAGPLQAGTTAATIDNDYGFGFDWRRPVQAWGSNDTGFNYASGNTTNYSAPSPKMLPRTEAGWASGYDAGTEYSHAILKLWSDSCSGTGYRWVGMSFGFMAPV
ncbi:MAG: hypothetical protein Q6353_016550, partial [Candidatus Sigynarchaeum springense]